MTEKEIKNFCKWLIDNGNRNFTKIQKEILKKAVEKTKNLNELRNVALSTLQQEK